MRSKSKPLLRLLATIGVTGLLGYSGYIASVRVASAVNLWYLQNRTDEWVSIGSPPGRVTKLLDAIRDEVVVETEAGSLFTYCGRSPQWDICWQEAYEPTISEAGSCEEFDLMHPPEATIALVEDCDWGEEPSIFRFALQGTGEVLAYKKPTLAGRVFVQVARAIAIIVIGSAFSVLLGIVFSLWFIWGWKPKR